MAAVTPESINRIMRKMIELAEGGDSVAARLVLERVAGKPVQPVVFEQLPVEVLVKTVVVIDNDANL